MPVLLRLLYGQTLVRNGKSARKDGMKIRRISILSAMVGMARMELRQFVGIGLDSFADFITPATPADKLVGDEAAPFKLLSETPESDNAMDVDDDEAPRGKGHRVAMAAQVSFFKLLAEMIKQLGFKATPIFHEALVVLLRSTYEAQKQLDAANLELQAYLAAKGDAVDAAVADADDPADNDEDDDDDNNVNDDEEVAADEETAGDERGRIESKRRQARMIRQLATRGLTGLFTLQTPDFDFEPYMPCVYEVVVNPRLDLLSVENTQNPSALLLLFRSWTLTPKYLPYLTGYNPRTFSMLVSILVAPKVQAPVVNLILDILQTYLDYSPEQAEKAFRLTPEQAEACGVIAKQTIQDHVSQILSHMKVCFAGVFSEAAAQGQTGKSSNILLRQIHLLSRVADYTTQQTADAKVLLDLLLPMLKRPNGAVNERTKADVLAIMLRFVPIVLDQNDDTFTDDERLALFNTYVDTVSVGLSRLRLPTARSLMCEILSVLARIDLERGHPQLEVAAGIVQDVNAFSEHRIDEPDFDRRLAAYAKLNDEIWDKPDQLSARAWVPILHNLVFFAQDHDEMSIRSNASYGLLRFIARVKQANTCEEAEGSDEVRLVNRNVVSIVLPSIKHAFTSKHDIVRNEFLVILRTAVREVGQYFDQLRDLQVLDNPDEEANFYYNIMHIQTHRRMRAMRRFRALVTANANED
ncbi:U3 snoRNP protein, partial [Linderina pennispora]